MDVQGAEMNRRLQKPAEIPHNKLAVTDQFAVDHGLANGAVIGSQIRKKTVMPIDITCARMSGHREGV